MISWKSFIFVMSRKKKFNLEIQGVEFIRDSHVQTFLSTLYIKA